ncbi:hypothetical protein LT85_p016 (plasmid) [Collimonas arenae]|uniref:Uncharacterized protein n=1 Tax=Collimonas arenae TaxID=279058 RepID=A0A0A1FKE6_9BURK|nr:hypothetical protein [Collimonas arenae]AIY44195.1 hypothetical protein LT85_p016 [Collimonas arenae]
MRKLLIIIGVLIGAYFFLQTLLKPMADPRTAMLPQTVIQPEQKTGNPLLTATKEQFSQWFPTHCEADLYFQPTQREHTRDVCIFNITKRVEANTGVHLTIDDIVNADVVSHWKQVTGAK